MQIYVQNYVYAMIKAIQIKSFYQAANFSNRIKFPHRTQSILSGSQHFENCIFSVRVINYQLASAKNSVKRLAASNFVDRKYAHQFCLHSLAGNFCSIAMCWVHILYSVRLFFFSFATWQKTNGIKCSRNTFYVLIFLAQY